MTHSHRLPARLARLAAPVALVLLLGWPASAHAGWNDLAGHISAGYAKLFVDKAPGGSLSLAGGLDLPVTGAFRAGFDVGFSLLGSRNETQGSLFASVDYSSFEALGLLHWRPDHLGPVARVSAGAGVMTTLAEIAAAGGGAAFRDLARDEVAPAVALQATLMQRNPAPVRTGIELGTRVGFGEKETWTIVSARLTFHY